MTATSADASTLLRVMQSSFAASTCAASALVLLVTASVTLVQPTGPVILGSQSVGDKPSAQEWETRLGEVIGRLRCMW